MARKAKSPAKDKGGRPTIKTEAILGEICERISLGETMLNICRDEHMPGLSTVKRWLLEDEEFRATHARAREEQAHAIVDQMLDIADDSSRDTYMDSDGNERENYEIVARSRLRIDSRKWLAGKLFPKVYGDKQQVEQSGPNGGPINTALEISVSFSKPESK